MDRWSHIVRPYFRINLHQLLHHQICTWHIICSHIWCTAEVNEWPGFILLEASSSILYEINRWPKLKCFWNPTSCWYPRFYISSARLSCRRGGGYGMAARMEPCSILTVMSAHSIDEYTTLPAYCIINSPPVWSDMRSSDLVYGMSFKQYFNEWSQGTYIIVMIQISYSNCIINTTVFKS